MLRRLVPLAILPLLLALLLPASVLAIDPDIDEGHRLFAHEKYEEALEHYLKALERNENDAELNYRTGMAYFCLMDFNSTAKYFEKAVALDQNIDYSHAYSVLNSYSSPLFIPGDVVLFDNLHYEYKKIKRNDVVRLDIQHRNTIFTQLGIPKSNKVLLTLRAVGLPGDILEINNNKIIINKEHVYNTQLNKKEYFFKKNRKITIPRNHFFLKGISNSSRVDSALFGFINRDDIIGKILLVFASFYNENGEEKVRKERIGLKIK